jgi:hypothetical protein
MALPRRGELILFLASLLACVGALELSIRLGVVPLPEYVLSDGWQRERWLRRAGEDLVTKHRVDKHHPVLGWTLLENLAGVPLNKRSVHSNSAGMRGRREYPVERGPGPRVVALGDSFTFGQCVGDEETFAARLEQRIAPGEVLNLAVHGYGHDQMLLRLREQGLAYRPDWILLGFFNGDVDRNALGFRDYLKPHFRLRGDRLLLQNVPIPAPEDFAQQLQLRSANYAEMLWDTLFAKRLERRNRKRSEAILREVAAEGRKIGARVAFVYLPGRRQSEVGEAWPRRVYKHVCEDGDVLCIDPTPRIHAFLRGEADAAGHFSCHYSPAIHGLIAEEIAAALGLR